MIWVSHLLARPGRCHFIRARNHRNRVIGFVIVFVNNHDFSSSELDGPTVQYDTVQYAHTGTNSFTNTSRYKSPILRNKGNEQFRLKSVTEVVKYEK